MDTRRPAGQRRSLGLRLAQVLALCLCLQLLWPALTSVHVEGFSGQIQSLALVLAEQGSVAGHDLARPLVSQFIFLTRPGVVDLLALGDRLLGYSGDLGFRVLTLLSLAGFLLGSAAFALRQARVPLALGLLACVLTPGMVELGFYFNDNVVSGAFAALALAAATLARPSLGALLSGALFGMAVLCRIDAVLAGPLLFLVYILRQQDLRSALARLALMAAAALAVHAVAALVNGATLVDAWRITRIFASQHLDGHGRLPGRGALLYFFGAVAPLLVAIGAAVQWKSRPSAGWRRWAWLAAFYGYPLLLLLYVLRTTLEIRYFLPLLGPVLAMHAGAGLQTVLGWARGADRRRRQGAFLIGALAVVLLAMPPTLPIMRDGPRVLLGRLWSPMLWRHWQEAVNDSMDVARSVVADVSRLPVATIVSTHWNDEFYLRLRLFEAGYRETPVEASCHPLSRYVAGSRVVWHVRVQPQYWLPRLSPDVAAAMPLLGVERCAALRAPGVVWVTTFGPVRPESAVHGFLQRDFTAPPYRLLGLALDEAGHDERQAVLQYPMMAARRYEPQRLDAIARRAARFVELQQPGSGVTPDAMLQGYEAAFGAR